MNINWGAILSGAGAFVAVLIFKILLDLKLVQLFVKYFSWLPVRNYFRTKPISIAGSWEQTWSSAGSQNFIDNTDRHSYCSIKQLGSYCYAEFLSKRKTYVVFCRVVNDYLVGDWYDKNDSIGYFGTFHLQILDSSTMEGRWIGHSKKLKKVQGDEWYWNKVT